MRRTERRSIAEETVRILQQGSYECQSSAVDVGAQIAACTAQTVFYPAAPTQARAEPTTTAPHRQTAFEVVDEGTLDAAQRLAAQGWRVAALNFASAKHPGGGFLGGAEAQEENIARNSGLYASLTSPAARGMYESRPKDALYSDAMVYSPACPVFREGRTGALLPSPWTCSFITAAAPNAGVARTRGFGEPEILAALEQRAEKVLAVAAERGYEAVVLGAWGCGVFKNEPTDVASAFARLLHGKFHGRFAYVSFAVCGPTANRAAFAAAFGGEGRMSIAPAPAPAEGTAESPAAESPAAEGTAEGAAESTAAEAAPAAAEERPCGVEGGGGEGEGGETAPHKGAEAAAPPVVRWASPIAVDESGEPCVSQPAAADVPEWMREAQAKLDATGWAPGFVPPPTPAQPPLAFGAASGGGPEAKDG
jgi:uncharacterized protein (TIGR02452 family)